MRYMLLQFLRSDSFCNREFQEFILVNRLLPHTRMRIQIVDVGRRNIRLESSHPQFWLHNEYTSVGTLTEGKMRDLRHNFLKPLANWHCGDPLLTNSNNSYW